MIRRLTLGLLALSALLAVLALQGCNGGEPEPVVGDNPAAANARTSAEASTPAQKAARANAKPQGNPW